jgi:hypothetical protein
MLDHLAPPAEDFRSRFQARRHAVEHRLVFQPRDLAIVLGAARLDRANETRRPIAVIDLRQFPRDIPSFTAGGLFVTDATKRRRPPRSWKGAPRGDQSSDGRRNRGARAACTNIIAHGMIARGMATVRRVSRNVTYWRAPALARGWAGAGPCRRPSRKPSRKPARAFARVPIKWNHLIDKDAVQIQRFGACRNRKRRALFT